MPAISRMRSAVALPFVLLAMLASIMFTSVAAAPQADAATRSQLAWNAVRIAQAQVGDPYRYGAAGPSAFDCSGLVYYAYRNAGFGMPRTSGSQSTYTRRIWRTHMQTGDLVFFYSGGRVYHVAIFVSWHGDRPLLLHSPRSGGRVSYTYPWTNAWFPGTVR